MRNPIVSVILPVYNGENHISECIESILSQTYNNFEFIIVDDASTDNTPHLLKKYAKKDSRIKIITHNSNQKQTAAANTACKFAKGKYIARMDADDVALPFRLDRQVKYLESNLDFGLVGSWSDRINNYGKIFDRWIVETNTTYLKWSFLFQTNFAHASAMMRNNIAKEVGYYQSPEAEDFDLWSRISTISKIGCIPEILQKRRVWEGQLNLKVPAETVNCVHQIIQKNIKLILGKEISLNDVKNIHNVITQNDKCLSITKIIETKTLIIELFNTFLKRNKLNSKEKMLVSKDVAQKLYTLKLWLDELTKWKGLILFLQIAIINKRFAIYIILNKILGKKLISNLF